ncbi:MAG: hypothetical protein IJT94_04915 [Oscillibacter sp.]|nr:hypothetical protein [Oscillibacter sp.]
MSMGAEMLVEALIQAELERQEFEQEYVRAIAMIDAGIWVTREGRSIKVKEMDSCHIKNAKAMAERQRDHLEEELFSCDEDEMRDEILCRVISMFQKELESRYPPMDPALIYG